MRRFTFTSAIFGIVLGSLGGVDAAIAQSAPAQGAPQMAKLAVEAPHALAHAMLLRHTSPNQLLHVAIGLPFADPAGAEAFAESVNDPKSPNYHHFISPEEVGARFGQPLDQIQKVARYLAANGFDVKLVAKNRLGILAEGNVAQAEAAFNTRIDDYQAPDSDGNGQAKRFFSFSKPLQIPAELASAIASVDGLENATRARPRISPNQTRVLYNTAPMFTGGFQGQGRTVAISSFDGFRLSNVPLFYAQYGLPTPAGGVGSNIQVVTISGGMGSGTCSGEGDLDIQMVLGQAPLCNLIVYDGGGWNLIGVLTQEVNDNKADVITDSNGFSLASSTASSAHNLHVSMSAQGITYMAATGDYGTNLQGYDYPNIEPEVLQVGGTVASVDATGNRLSENGWNGSGSGWSLNTASFNTRPSWQVGTGVPTNINYRMFPDVALNAGAAYEFFLNGSLQGGYCGTSFSSPIFAGSLAVAEQRIINLGGLPPDNLGHQRFGRIQNLIYSQAGRSDVWLDLTDGNTGTLPNGAAGVGGVGWDFVTGWGVINFNAFVGTQVSTSPDFSITTTSGAQSVNVGAGASNSAVVTALNGFTGTTNLGVSGLPTGASSGLSPSAIAGSGSSTLTISTSTSTPAGSYPITVTGTSGSKVHSISFTLTVTAPNFSLAMSPSSQSIAPGAGASYTATLSALNGFSGATSLSVSGLPSGASAGFSPAALSGAGSSVLTVSTSSLTPGGSYTLTITGTSGSLVHSATVNLTVNAPDFTIGASAASLSVVHGQSVSDTINIGALNGFGSAVSLSISGLPSGASAAFTPSSVTGSGSSALRISTLSTTATGNYTLTITGSGGGVTHTARVTLSVRRK